MTRWIIGTVAEGVAADMSAARASSWMQEGANNDVRGYLHAAIVKQQILTDIQTLAEAGHIHPRHPGSGHASEMGSPVDATHYLTRSDLEKVLHFVRRDVHSKQDFLRELDEWRASGRYMLAQAADLLEAEAGERYDQILRRLKQAVRDNELNMYEPGRNQKLQYAAPRQAAAVRDFYEEAYWNDLNAWLSVHEPRISWRFPHPPGSATSVPVTESAASESVKLRSDEPEATKIEDRSA